MYTAMHRGFLLLAMFWTAPAFGQGVESITVSGDPVHLLQTGANDAAFGLDKPLLETPRAVTLVSDATIARYGVSGVNDLTAITPSASTISTSTIVPAFIPTPRRLRREAKGPATSLRSAAG